MHSNEDLPLKTGWRCGATDKESSISLSGASAAATFLYQRACAAVAVMTLDFSAAISTLRCCAHAAKFGGR